MTPSLSVPCTGLFLNRYFSLSAIWDARKAGVHGHTVLERAIQHSRQLPRPERKADRFSCDGDVGVVVIVNETLAKTPTS